MFDLGFHNIIDGLTNKPIVDEFDINGFQVTRTDHAGFSFVPVANMGTFERIADARAAGAFLATGAQVLD